MPYFLDFGAVEEPLGRLLGPSRGCCLAAAGFMLIRVLSRISFSFVQVFVSAFWLHWALRSYLGDVLGPSCLIFDDLGIIQDDFKALLGVFWKQLGSS